MYTVLAPVDEHRQRVGAQIDAILELPAATDEVSVDVLHVEEDLDFSAEDIDDVPVGELREDREDLADLPETVRTAVQDLREAGVDVRVHTVIGNPATAIVDVAERFDVDQLVLGARRQSPVGKVLFGSVAQSVILDTDRPVTVVPA